MSATTRPPLSRHGVPLASGSLESRLVACCYDSIRETAQQLGFSGQGAVAIEALNAHSKQIRPPITTDSGQRLGFAPQQSAPTGISYEACIFQTGSVPTRPGNVHDAFNALVWLSFPQTKAALNGRQFAAQRPAARPGNRTPAQDSLTLFDECGVIVACDRSDLLKLIADFQWKELFWNRREEVIRHMKFFLFGHGLMEQMLKPYVGLTGKALMLAVEPELLSATPDMALSQIDGRCASLIAAGHALLRGRDLLPLPALGIPGWSPDNGVETYYDNLQYFRTGRRAAPSRTE
jgi:Protein of unknown function (DUF3025)